MSIRAAIRPRTSRFAALATGVALALSVPVGAAHADPPTDDPQTAAQYAAGWLADQFATDTDGAYIPATGGGADASGTLQSALALAAAGAEEATFDDAVAWLAANASTLVTVGGADDPGRIGYLLLLADAAGEDPTDFGGVDLVDRLDGTLTTGGLYGTADATWDGVFRQSLAVLGLRANGEIVPAAARNWLAGQQCGATSPAGAAGGFAPYRADTTVACTASGPETNSTALAVQALAATDATTYAAAIDDALDYLAGAQEADAGFPFAPGFGSDPNSTALVVQAIDAAGEDPAGTAWQVGGSTPYDSLLSWQLGCDADPADIGAFASPWSGGAPDQLATQQAVWGAAGTAFPLDPDFTAPTPVPCTA
ncbi:hypothetical protein [Streptomyces avicenniae]|uniref:hypothetical protein n=1 Tax=Streptomyces avicenniae TaxID=500153 RepID=UPI00069C067E|nr:hypothetical protein [Streptomyces avicenniae]